MDTFIKYLLISSIAIGATYFSYLIVFGNDTNYRLRRVFVLTLTIVSLIIPFSHFDINMNLGEKPVISQIVSVFDANPENSDSSTMITENYDKGFTGVPILLTIYLIVVFLLVIKALVQVIVLLYTYFKSERIRINNEILVYNNRFGHSFSFFNWIFVNRNFKENKDLATIIDHECVHIRQLHTIDLLFLELLAILMWFNPVVWLLRNSVRQIHEYIVDEEVISSGMDKLKYQSLLVNLVAESDIIGFTSKFNKTLIVKRIEVMNKNLRNKSKFKLLVLIPISAFLIFGAACVNNRTHLNNIAAIELPDIYPLYTGLNNSVKIIVSGYDNKSLDVDIDQGSITEEGGGSYMVNVDEPGFATITVKHAGQEVQKIKYPVKDPDQAYVKMRNDEDCVVTGNALMNGLNCTENEFLQVIYWIKDSLDATLNKSIVDIRNYEWMKDPLLVEAYIAAREAEKEEVSFENILYNK